MVVLAVFAVLWLFLPWRERSRHEDHAPHNGAMKWIGILPFTAVRSARTEWHRACRKRGLPDPNFSETVVLVTHTDEGKPVGVILNRPTTLKLADVAPRIRGAKDFAERSTPADR